MDFLAAAQHYATDLSSDFSMDPTMEDAAMPGKRTWSQPEPQTDDQDPATPGGPAPYNAVVPFSEPVVTDPEWLNPQDAKPPRYSPMPHMPGPDVDVTTLHNARLSSYESKVTRFR